MVAVCKYWSEKRKSFVAIQTETKRNYILALYLAYYNFCRIDKTIR
jgi:hypothetical protein